MKTKQIQVGGLYTAKVSGTVVPVRIRGTFEYRYGRDGYREGWVGVNTKTGREIRIKSPQRLRAVVEA